MEEDASNVERDLRQLQEYAGLVDEIDAFGAP